MIGKVFRWRRADFGVQVEYTCSFCSLKVSMPKAEELAYDGTPATSTPAIEVVLDHEREARNADNSTSTCFVNRAAADAAGAK